MKILSKTFLPPKAMATLDFMKVVGTAKKDVQTSIDTNAEAFEKSFKDAVQLLKEFSATKNPAVLKKAAHEFLQLIKLKPSKVESYVYLAYILYLYDKTEEARKYIKLAEAIDPDYEFIKDVKDCIYSLR
jgi:tetratricopeptide (TPR) repeat protein